MSAKAGRPKRAIDLNRTCGITGYFTMEEEAYIEEHCADGAISMSEFIRHCVKAYWDAVNEERESAREADDAEQAI